MAMSTSNMSTSKIALLVLAHEKLEQLALVLNSLEHEDVYFFVHIDRKVKITSEQYEIFNQIRNCHVITRNESMTLNWGGRSQVDAMLLLLNKAYASQVVIERFGFISGADYPLITADQLVGFFRNNENEYIRVDRQLTEKNSNRVTNLNLYDVTLLNYRNFKGIRARLTKLIVDAFRLIKVQKLSGNIRIYHGSAWMFLTRNTIHNIFSFNEQNPWFYNFFKYSFGSDELFFHSILMHKNSTLVQNHESITLKEQLNNNLYGVHYIDWDTSYGVSSIGGPKWLELKDISKVESSKVEDALFVRKVNLLDKELIAALDNLRYK
jgi:hypothetical protein